MIGLGEGQKLRLSPALVTCDWMKRWSEPVCPVRWKRTGCFLLFLSCILCITVEEVHRTGVLARHPCTPEGQHLIWILVSSLTCLGVVIATLFVRMRLAVRAFSLFLSYFTAALNVTSLVIGFNRQVTYFDWNTWLFVVVLPVFIFANVGSALRCLRLRKQRRFLATHGARNQVRWVRSWMSNFYDLDLGY